MKPGKPKGYVPQQGDFIYLDFDPQSGHEQRGRRPALVISKSPFNAKTGLAMVCPITDTNRSISLHVPVGADTDLTGFVMVEQIKSVDFRARSAQLIAQAPAAVLDEVHAKLDACLY